MTIKKIELDGLNPEHPLAKVVDEINTNLDSVINAINSIEGGQGVVGPTGAKGDKGDTGQQGIEGPAGKDGKDGVDGKDGAPGAKGEQGIQGERGLPGKDGKDGLPGKDGKDGLPGATGPKGDTGAQGIQGLSGKDGINGKDGVSITSATVNNTGNLIITKSDGTTVDAGKVTPAVTTAPVAVSAPAPAVGGPPVVGGAMNPMAVAAPVIVNTMQGFASGFVNAGQFVTLDNLKFTVTTGGSRGLSCATVAGSVTLGISATYGMAGGCSGSATAYPGCVYNTTPSGSWFGWSFPNAGDASTYNINDYTNKRFYRVTLMIGPSYNSNFISIERLY